MKATQPRAPGGRRRTPQAERSETTRAALIGAGRELFAARGYAAVGTEQLVQRAGVTRGALYHHFRDKRDLFRAVYEQTERELVEAFAARAIGIDDAWELLVAGVGAFLDTASDPQLMRIGLIDAPAVLGWVEWREIGTRYVLGLIVATLERAMDDGVVRRRDVGPLAQLLFGALAEAGMAVANAPDPAAARPGIESSVLALLEGLRA